MGEQNYHWITIGLASRLVGIPVKNLRYLHDRGYVPVTWIEVGDRRVRVYNEATIERLKQIAALIKDGYPPSVAARKTAEAAP